MVFLKLPKILQEITCVGVFFESVWMFYGRKMERRITEIHEIILRLEHIENQNRVSHK